MFIFLGLAYFASMFTFLKNYIWGWCVCLCVCVCTNTHVEMSKQLCVLVLSFPHVSSKDWAQVIRLAASVPNRLLVLVHHLLSSLSPSWSVLFLLSLPQFLFQHAYCWWTGKALGLYAGFCKTQGAFTPVEVTVKLCSRGEFHHIQAILKMRLTSQEPRKSLSLVLAAFSFPPKYITSA